MKSAHGLASLRSRNGFTLIELLVVIAIIAILSVIGIAIFTGVQKGARDAKRKGDIDAITKALEVHYSQCGSGYYCNMDNTWFASGSVLTDPLSGLNSCNGNFCGYCISGKNVQPDDPNNRANGGCGVIGVISSSYWFNLVQSGSPGVLPGTSTQPSEYIVCANLETVSNGKYYYCKPNQQ